MLTFLLKISQSTLSSCSANHCNIVDWLATGRTRKHFGLNCIRPFMRRLCLFSSVIYRGTRTAPSVRPPRGRAPNSSGRMESSISEEGKLRVRNGLLNFVLSFRLLRNRKRFLTCRKSTTRDLQFYFPSEGRHAEDFLRPKKIRRLRSGANPRSWVPEASMLTTRPPKPLYCNITADPRSRFRRFRC
jgi:hypothetical protein